MSEQETSDTDLSARGLRWIEPDINTEAVAEYARQSGLDEVLAALIYSRGVAAKDVDAFLHPTLKTFCPDPSSFADMDKAAAEIGQALLENRKVCVFADYDVDGATSAAQLNRYFRHFGRELFLYVPDRLKEGYGPSPDAFQSLKDDGVELVITVDCGAAAVDALDHARNIGLPVIVLDHHLMGASIPNCLALVNPNRQDCSSGQGHLAAAGVVFVLLIALNRYFRTQKAMTGSELPELMSYLDLCALGTLCDMAPLKGVNRAFVVQGLKQVAQDQSVGLLALSQVSGRSAPRRVGDLTFGIGPQLNAGGRLGDPWLATRLLSAEDMGEALSLAEQLNSLNEARKAVENDILDAARRQIELSLEHNPNQKVLIAMGEGWHPGVIGIVAGRLKDEFHKPVIVIGHGDGFGELAKGSARSVQNMNIGEAISAAATQGILVSGGGHAMAGGLSMEPENLERLSAFMNDYFAEDVQSLVEARNVKIDLDVMASSLTLDLLTVVEQAGPYGAGALKPLFRIRDAIIHSRRIVGANHLKVSFGDESGRCDAIAWRCADRPLGDALLQGQKVDLIGYIERNSWQGRDAVQFEIFDAMKNS